MLITDEEGKDFISCLDSGINGTSEFKNYASNTSDIMKLNYSKDISCDNLLS
jgi:hypothetical protein